MTKREAIDVLKANYPDRCFEDLREAIDLAIESLRGDVPNTNNGDTISRQAAIVALKDALLAWSCMAGWRDEKILDALKGAPSAQPEIIRCKDCMHNGSFDTDCPIDWDGKEYCSFAERRTE